MTLTKKRLILITFTLTILYFIPLLSLPEHVVGARGDNFIVFVPRILYLAGVAAVTTVIILVLIFKRDFVSAQMFAFNRYKYYLSLMVKRDFITRYRKSVLGVVWSVLNPILMMLILTFVFQYLFRFEIENMPVYIISGRVIFDFFQESTTLSMNSIIASEGVIKKIYVPKYIFPLSKMISSLMNLGFMFIAFLIVFIVTGTEFQWTMLLVPLPLLYLFIFSLGVAMFMASMSVFFRDLSHLYVVLLSLWMFMTPIFYPIEIIPDWLLPYYGLNPMLHFLNIFRAMTMDGTVLGLWDHMVSIGNALAAFCFGTYVFMRQQDRYILSM